MNRKESIEFKISDLGNISLESLTSEGNIKIRLQWLGQAGFLIESKKEKIMIDPYLSDSLAEKYKGSIFPHQRMMPIPVAPEKISGVDVYFSTHQHADHLDEHTVAAISRTNPNCRFVIPASSRDSPKAKSIKAENLIFADAFSPFKIDKIKVYPIPAAHEILSIDEAGHHNFLGYIISMDGIVIFHSGDCVPYDGLIKNLSDFKVDIALLPINGRDEIRKAAGILGNFTLTEAVELAHLAGFRYTIGHHYGMFNFNTIDFIQACEFLSSRDEQSFIIAQMGKAYDFVLNK
jgi:L-ascorbate metabolism protein UlaG (beta-lactamase superfamily)